MVDKHVPKMYLVLMNLNSGKGKQKSNSFLGNTSQTLQSFSSSTQASDVHEEAGLALDMTEDELAIFNDSKPLISNAAAEEVIVVRYSAPEAINHLMMMDDKPAEPGYATVNEIAMQEEKREKKKERKISKKSFLKAIVPKKDNKTKKNPSSKATIGGPEMGFKPQFHSNPLTKLGGSIPPTPPPTPATAASIAPSDEGKQYKFSYRRFGVSIVLSITNQTTFCISLLLRAMTPTTNISQIVVV